MDIVLRITPKRIFLAIVVIAIAAFIFISNGPYWSHYVFIHGNHVGTFTSYSEFRDVAKKFNVNTDEHRIKPDCLISCLEVQAF